MGFDLFRQKNFFFVFFAESIEAFSLEREFRLEEQRTDFVNCDLFQWTMALDVFHFNTAALTPVIFRQHKPSTKLGCKRIAKILKRNEL
jgi:hypothetical protein